MGGVLLTRVETARKQRRAPASHDPVARVRVRTGRDYLVLNISDSGVLIEGARLLPGAHLDLHVVTRDGRVLVRSRVRRACVHAVSADAIVYRVALAFDWEIDTSPIGYQLPGDVPALSVKSGKEYPAANETGQVTVAKARTA